MSLEGRMYAWTIEDRRNEIFEASKRAGIDALGGFDNVDTLIDVASIASTRYEQNEENDPNDLLVWLDCVLRVQELVDKETYAKAIIVWMKVELGTLWHYQAELIKLGCDAGILDNIFDSLVIFPRR